MWSFLILGLFGQMGTLSFPITGNPACRKHFTEGMLALHSFMYPRAHREFQQAAKADPGCAMARWGDAMAYHHPLWGEDEPEAARQALAEVGAEGSLTAKERAFLGAARALYHEDPPKARLKAWLEAAERMHEDYPADDEVALQHALALIANSEQATDQGRMMRAAAIGLDVLARKPNHPGAAHYIIHACDTPDHAVLALPAAERYARTAPAASHALHMPSHIFVQLGMWERVARSNEASWAASEKDVAAGAGGKYDWHSYAWLTAAYLELGQVQHAERLLADLAARIAREDSSDLRFAYSLAAHLLLTDGGAWDRLEAILKPIAGHLPLEEGEAPESLGCAQHAPGGSRAGRHPIGLYSQQRLQDVRAEEAMRRGDEAGVKAALERVKAIQAAMEPWRPLFTPRYEERRRAFESALLLGARAWRDKSEPAVGKFAESIKKLAEAGDPFAGGPAFDPPGEQLLGELYLAAGRPKEALSSFDAALQRHPRLSRSLLGAARAAKAAGAPEIARARYATLAAQWASADPDLPALAEARAGAK
jgi:hypothetical protein